MEVCMLWFEKGNLKFLHFGKKSKTKVKWKILFNYKQQIQRQNVEIQSKSHTTHTLLVKMNYNYDAQKQKKKPSILQNNTYFLCFKTIHTSVWIFNKSINNRHINTLILYIQKTVLKRSVLTSLHLFYGVKWKFSKPSAFRWISLTRTRTHTHT